MKNNCSTKTFNVMIDYIFLGTTVPVGERCAQLNHTNNFLAMAKMEARTYIKQLKRVYGENPEGTNFAIATCPHDFGDYIDIKFFFDDDDLKHVEYMNSIEEGCEEWDCESNVELKRLGYALDDEEEESLEESFTTDNGPTGHGDICMSDADSGL